MGLDGEGRLTTGHVQLAAEGLGSIHAAKRTVEVAVRREQVELLSGWSAG
jgi:hypothetical protein